MTEEAAISYLLALHADNFQLRIKSTDNLYYDTKGDGTCGYRAIWQAEQRAILPIEERVGSPGDISYEDHTARAARIVWLERLLVTRTPPLDQSKLQAYIQWLRTSDTESPNWHWFPNYYRGQSRWLGNHDCYETALELSPMAIFTRIDRSEEHQGIFQLSSHSLAYELGRFTGPNLVKIVEASNYIGLSPGHFYLLPSSILDVQRLRSCIRDIVRAIKARQGNGHILSWASPQRFSPPVAHECPYIYTLPNDPQIRSNAQRIMMEDIRAREDDDIRAQARERIASMALALGLQVVEVPGDGNCFLHAARFALLQLHGWNNDLVPTHQAMRAQVCSFLRENRAMLDINGVTLDELREAYVDYRQEPTDGMVLEPPRVTYYDSWDQWVNEMERPAAYVDHLFAQGVSYVYGVGIRLISDMLPEPWEFYLGMGKPLETITLTFRAGGMHYSATRLIPTAATGMSKKRQREEEHKIGDEPIKHNKAGKGKQAKESKGNTAKSQQPGTTKAQRRASERFTKKKRQSEKDRKLWANESEDSSDSRKQANRNNEATVSARTARRSNRTRKRAVDESGEDNDGRVAKQRRRSGIESFFLNDNVNVNVNEEIDASDECMDVPTDGPEFFDHG